MALALILFGLAACGGEVTTSASTSVASTSAANSTGTTTTASATTSTGAGGSGGAAPTGGMSGIEMIIDGQARPPEHVMLTVIASQFIGGIDRWVFDFTWLYDDPIIDDEEEQVDLTVRIMRIDPMFEPNEMEATYGYPEDSGNPLEMLPGTHTRWGVFMKTTPINPVSGTFSIRRIANQFDGYVSIDAEAQDGPPFKIHVAGPFLTPVP